MAQLELKTRLQSGSAFRLFRQDGTEIRLPDESDWEIIWPEDGFPDPDKKLLLEIEPGQFWLLEKNNNVTYAFSLEANDEVEKEEVYGVANGFGEQSEETAKLAVIAPTAVLDTFREMSK